MPWGKGADGTVSTIGLHMTCSLPAASDLYIMPTDVVLRRTGVGRARACSQQDRPHTEAGVRLSLGEALFLGVNLPCLPHTAHQCGDCSDGQLCCAVHN